MSAGKLPAWVSRLEELTSRLLPNRWVARHHEDQTGEKLWSVAHATLDGKGRRHSVATVDDELEARLIAESRNAVENVVAMARVGQMMRERLSCVACDEGCTVCALCKAWDAVVGS